MKKNPSNFAYVVLEEKTIISVYFKSVPQNQS